MNWLGTGSLSREHALQVGGEAEQQRREHGPERVPLAEDDGGQCDVARTAGHLPVEAGDRDKAWSSAPPRPAIAPASRIVR